MTIKVQLSVSKSQKSIFLNPSDFDLTDEKWNALSADEKRALIDGWVDKIDQPYWQIEKIDESK